MMGTLASGKTLLAGAGVVVGSAIAYLLVRSDGGDPVQTGTPQVRGGGMPSNPFAQRQQTNQRDLKQRDPQATDETMSKAQVVNQHADALPSDKAWPQVTMKDQTGRQYNPAKYNWIVDNVLGGGSDGGDSDGDDGGDDGDGSTDYPEPRDQIPEPWFRQGISREEWLDQIQDGPDDETDIYSYPAKEPSPDIPTQAELKELMGTINA